MSREIKFRAWDGVRMINDPHILTDPKLSQSINHWLNVRTYKLMQYTGLKDKNGVEIYEGDIVQYDNADKAKVIFKEGGFCGYNGYASSSDEAYLLLTCDNAPFEPLDFELEVIGNIHKNTELL